MTAAAAADIAEFRPLSEKEIQEFLDNAERHRIWKAWTDFARIFYGPEAYKVSIEMNGEYNDEGGTAYNISSWSVEDRAGKPLHSFVDELVYNEVFYDDDDSNEHQDNDNKSLENFIDELTPEQRSWLLSRRDVDQWQSKYYRDKPEKEWLEDILSEEFTYYADMPHPDDYDCPDLIVGQPPIQNFDALYVKV